MQTDPQHAGASGLSGRATEGPDEEELRAQATARDALAHYARYLEAFNARDVDTAAAFYASPCTIVRQQGVQVLQGQDDARAMMSRNLQVLAGKAFAVTRFARRRVRVMNERAVLLGGEFVRERADGTPIESVCCTYVLARQEDGWRIVTMMPHPPSNLLPQAPEIPGEISAGA